MADNTMLALLTVVSMLSAISMAAFAWRVNKDWSAFAEKMNNDWAKVVKEQNENWFAFYKQVYSDSKLEDKHDGNERA